MQFTVNVLKQIMLSCIDIVHPNNASLNIKIWSNYISAFKFDFGLNKMCRVAYVRCMNTNYLSEDEGTSYFAFLE